MFAVGRSGHPCGFSPSAACRWRRHDGVIVRRPTTGPRQVIAIGGQTPKWCILPTTLAQALGYYEAEGLDVELQDFEGGAKALQALIGGSADVVSGYYDHTIQMAAEGREFVAFVTMLRYPHSRIRDVAAGGAADC